MSPKKIVIKKYENRRLYDVTNSRYVNLDEVARAVQEGNEIQVLDAVTGDDITRLVLTQIIIEGAKAPDSPFPLDVLREMVVASGKASQESAVRYMRHVADMYKSALQSFSHTMTPFELMQNMVHSVPNAKTDAVRPEPPSAGEPDSKQTRDGEGELRDLKKRIQELESLVLQQKSPKASKPRPKARGTRSKKS